MNWKEIFFNFEGRIGRQTFWIATIFCLVVEYGAEALLCSYFGLEMFPDVTSPIRDKITLFMALLMLWPYLAIGIKRQHDLNRSGKYFTVCFLLAISSFIPEAFGYPLFSQEEEMSFYDWFLMACGIFMLIWLIWYLVWQGFIKGTHGPNKYGPDPLAEEKEL